jgi:hypothetical protein
MRWPHELFLRRTHAAWMWKRLRRLFPQTLFACLMPNHVHVLPFVEDPAVARVALARTCGHLQRRTGIPDLFEPVPPAELVRPGKEPRVGRYVELNGCRKGHVETPLAGEWNTVRDVLGAVADPWVDAVLHRRVMGRGPEAWHRYLATDDRVRDRAPLAEVSAAGAGPSVWGPGAIAAAAVAAFRADVSAIQRRGPVRRLFLALAAEEGVRTVAPLVEMTGANERSVRRGLLASVPERWLGAARQCLADPRLTSGRPNVRIPDIRRL